VARIHTARYLLCSKAAPLEGGALLEDQGRILEVGTLAQLRKSAPALPVVDYGEAVLLPAFINAHTHLELSHYPAWASAVGVGSAACSFVDWILRLIQVKRNTPLEAMRAAIETGIRLSLEAGTAAVGDILSWYEGRDAYRGTPLSGRIFLETLGQDPLVTRQQFDKLNSVLQEQGVGRFEFGLSPHSPYTISPPYMSQIFELSRNKQLNCSTHIAESADEVAFLDGADGELVERLFHAVNWHRHRPEARHMRPVEYLAERGGLFDRQLLVHGVQLNTAEIALIADAGAQLVLCPRSNERLQVGTAPVSSLKRAGIRLALGTDSLASNSSLSMWDELAFAAGVYADALDARELFALATTGGAAALGLQGELGALQAGLRCSFQVVGLEEQIGAQRLIETLVNEGEGRQPEALVLDGQLVKPA
jgi:cytosine/adenosine deaminase-related metal-dependent hydrolase